MPKKRRSSSQEAFDIAKDLIERNKRLARLAPREDKKTPDVCPMCRRKM